MTEIDTSSYLKPGATPQQNMLQQIQGYGAIAQQKQALDASKFDLAKKHYDTLSNEISSIASAPNLSPELVQERMQNMVKMGLITPQQFSQTLTTMPSPQQVAQNPKALNLWAQQHLQRVQSAQQQFDSTYSKQQDINNTAGIVSGAVNPMRPGEFTPKTFIPNQASGATSSTVKQPELDEAGKPTGRYIDTALPDNVKQDLAAGRARMVNGRVIPVAPGTPLAVPVGQQGAPSVPNALISPQGSMGASVRGPAPIQQPTNRLMTGPQVGLPVGTPQGSEATQNALGSAAAAGAEALRNEASNAPQNKALLDNIEAQLNNANSGPLAKFIASKGAAINQVTKMIANREPIPTDVIKAHENFVKNATLLQQQQAKALGGTVSALANSEHAVPTLNFSTAGNREIIATLRGTQDAITAKNNAWQSYLDGGGNPQDFRKFENEFNKTFEPRAYQFPYLTKSEQKQVIDSLPSDSSRKEFFKRAAEAVRKGYIKPGSKGE